MLMLELCAIAMVVAIEALLLLFATFPGSHRLRKDIIAISMSGLQPLILWNIPSALFLLLDIYWNYEHRLKCEDPLCSAVKREHYEKSMIKSQRNLLLVLSALLLYWLLDRIMHMLIRIDYLYQHVKKLKDSKDSD